jgi:hypothetical protein
MSDDSDMYMIQNISVSTARPSETMKRTGRIIEGRIGFGFDGSRHKINSQKQSTQKIYGDRVPNLVTRTRRKADGWGAKSGNWSSQRNNPGRPQGDRMRGVHLHQDNGLN